MFKKIFSILTLLLIMQGSFACDICGCSTGNYFIGPYPQFTRHFIGTRYSFRSYKSVVANDASQYSKDIYQTMEIWGGINIGKKWQLMAFVPFNINKQSSDDGVSKMNGLGDITLMANYKIMDKNSGKNNRIIKQQLLLGGGIKLPTGKFAAEADDIIPGANNQPGTGSVDFIANAIYALRINSWGLNANAAYKMNTDAGQFRFGNRFNTNAFVFKTLPVRNVSFNPNLGLMYETMQANKLDKATIVATGGHVFLAAAGLETNIKKTTIGFNAQSPFSQNLSEGQTTARLRGMFHVTFSL